MPGQPRPSTPDPRPSRRGGRRPGAGAPKGNLNGLKTGRYSKQVQALKIALQSAVFRLIGNRPDAPPPAGRRSAR